VSCTADGNCTAVGDYINSAGSDLTLSEHWNGTAWATQQTVTSPGAVDSALTGVSCTQGGACTAVGQYTGSSGPPQTLAEQWDGTSWHLQITPTPPVGGSLTRVSCTAPTACSALGQASGTTLIYRWNGAAWSSQTIAVPVGATSTKLNGVACTAPTACTGVGGWRQIHCNNGQPSCNCFRYPYCTIKSGPLVETWNGTTWMVTSAPNLGGWYGGVLYDVSCTAAACTAVGQSNNTYTLAEYETGGTWTIQPTPRPGGSVLFQVSCTTSGVCEAVGDGNGTLAETWNATSGWAIQATPNPPGPANQRLSGVSCTADNACTAVGNYASPTGQVTLAEQWDGTTWTVRPTQNPPGPTAAP
jgi:hypothetical protein